MNISRWLSGKKICLPVQEMQVQSLSLKYPLEKEMTTHSSILAWEIPWTEEPWQATIYMVTKRQARLSMHTHILKNEDRVPY